MLAVLQVGDYSCGVFSSKKKLFRAIKDLAEFFNTDEVCVERDRGQDKYCLDYQFLYENSFIDCTDFNFGLVTLTEVIPVTIYWFKENQYESKRH